MPEFIKNKLANPAGISPLELLPTSRIIALAKRAGVDFGPGSPLERIRYFIKLGLLPHAARKVVRSRDLAVSESPNSLSPKSKDLTTNPVGLPAKALATVGHLPYWTVERLIYIDRLYKRGKTYQQIAARIRKQAERQKPFTSPSRVGLDEGGFTPRSPALPGEGGFTRRSLGEGGPPKAFTPPSPPYPGIFTKLAIIAAFGSFLLLATVALVLKFGGEGAGRFLQAQTVSQLPLAPDLIYKKNTLPSSAQAVDEPVLGLKESTQGFFDNVGDTASQIAAAVLRPFTNLALVLISGPAAVTEYNFGAVPPSSQAQSPEGNFLPLDPNGDISVPGSAAVTGSLSTASLTTDSLDANSLTISGSTALGTTASDTLKISASLISDLLPQTTNKYYLGSSAERFRSGYFANNIYVGDEAVLGSDGLTVKGSSYFKSTGGGSIYLSADSGVVYLAKGTNKLTNGEAGVDFTIDASGGGRVCLKSCSNYVDNSNNAQIGNNLTVVGTITSSGTGASSTAGPLTITSTTAPQLSVRYDSSNRLDVTTSSAGAVTLDAVGTGSAFTLSDDTTISGDLAVNGSTSADITSTTTTATLFNSTVTTLSLGGAATTALNLGNGSGNYTAINLGSGSGTHTIDIAGTGATGADTINIGTGGTGADTITIGSSASTTSLALTSGTGSQTFTSNVATGTTTTSGFVFDATAITSGTGLYLVSDSATTGRILDIATSGNTWTGNGTTNGLVNLASTSTAGTASSSSILLNVARSGANANTAHTAYGLYSAVTNTNATSGTNIAGYFTATGATTANYGIYLPPTSGGTTNVALCFDCDGTWTSSTVASGIQFGTDANAVNLYRSASDTLRTDDSLYVGGNLTVSGIAAANGDVDLGDTASDTVTFVGVVDSNIVADANDTRNLGSSAVRWNTGYFTTLDATNLAGTVITGSTSAATWTVNSDNSTNDAEISAVAFETGSAVFNAVLQWNSTSDAGRYAGYDTNFVSNYPISVISQVSGINQTFTSGSLFNYGQAAAHAITQGGAFVGVDIDFSGNITNTTQNQTGVLITLKDGSSSGTAIGFQTAGTLDYGLDIGGTIGTADIRLSNAETIANTTNGTITFAIDATAEVNLTATSLSPSTSDGTALGTTALMWADLFLASGAVVNFNNGDVTLTHGTDVLTVGGGNVDLGNNLLVNIGAAGTDFTANGGLTLAELLTVNDDVDFVFDAGENLLLNASSTANTTTAGVIDLNVSSATDSNRGLDIAYTHTATGATTSYGVVNAWASSAVVAGASVSQTGYGIYNTAAKTGADTATGTYSLYGLYSTASNTGRTDAGTVNTYGAFIDATGDASGTSSVFGLYIADVSGGDTNVALCFDCDGTYSAATVASGIQFGTDAATVTLYRSADNILRTGDGLTVDLDLIVSGGDITGTGDESIDIGEATANAITLLIDAAAEVILTSTALSPSTSDGNALGTTALMWADLFLASGSVINLNNGDVTLTHAANLLTLGGGDLNLAAQLDVEGYAAIGNGSALDAQKTLIIDRDFSGGSGDNRQLVVGGVITVTGGTNWISYADIHAGIGGITINSGGAHANVASLILREPNITETSGSVTTASTLYILDAPTEGDSNYALFVDAGAVQFDSTLSVDGTTTLSANVTLDGTAQFDINPAITNVSNTNNLMHRVRGTYTVTAANSGTGYSGYGLVALDSEALSGAFTTTEASTLLIEGAPTAAGGGSVTTAYALYVVAGDTRLAGDLLLPNATAAGSGLLFGGDAELFRGAANRLDLASGDSFNIVSGGLTVNNTSGDANLVINSTANTGVLYFQEATVSKHWLGYSATGNYLLLGTTDYDGAGSDGDILRVVDGTRIANFLGELDVDGYAAIGNGSALSASRTLIVDRAFSVASGDASQLLVGVNSAITTTGGVGNISLLQVQPGGVTINSGGTHNLVASARFVEPNITVTSGAVTNAVTVYIDGAPSEGAQRNLALYVASGDTLVSKFSWTDDTGDTNTTRCRNAAGNLASCTSLAKWKDNVETLSLGLDAVLALRPVSFDWNSLKSSPETVRHDLGFIAEEVAAVDPLLASYNWDTGELEGVRYGQMASLLVKAIQELNLKVDAGLTANGSLASQSGESTVDSQDYSLSTLTSDLLNPDGTLTTQYQGQLLTAEQIQKLVQEEVARQLASSSQSTVDSSQTSSTTSAEATESAALAEATAQALAELNALLSTADLSLSTLTVTGLSSLAQTQVAGTFSQDGTLIIDYGKQINVLASTLYLQNDSLAGDAQTNILVDIGGGKVTIDKDGNMVSNGEITASKINVGDQASGASTIGAGTTQVQITTPKVTASSLVFVTPTVSTAQPLAVTVKEEGVGFTVEVTAPSPNPIPFNWMVVN